MRRAAGRAIPLLTVAAACILLLCGPTPPALAESASGPAGRQSEQEFRLLPSGNRPLQLSHGFVHAPSVRVFVDGRLWQPDQDYRLRARSGLVIPLRGWVTTAADTTAAARALVMVTYEFLPVPLPPRRDLRPVAAAPNMTPSSPAGGLFRTGLATDGWRTGNLQVSGSKTVQVSSGSRREMTVDQNLRLTIMGQLTPEIAVRAFLSDDNLPVVPEGNTEELRDIDKVLVDRER